MEENKIEGETQIVPPKFPQIVRGVYKTTTDRFKLTHDYVDVYYWAPEPFEAWVGGEEWIPTCSVNITWCSNEHDKLDVLIKVGDGYRRFSLKYTP